ncbi:HAMP domain-containing sensor histidine kinase [uncultured Solobacterium sp.]|uniref:sensor histidine kinase n=1 Tax=uncultured Solobacterium sp. TaxID=747375 RepID=UPI0025DDD21D|nr:HAMP domain-containing sensor histidine kinase [uncultured Solobacterium sp.]
MNRRRSLQWKLTVITAIIVILSSLAISYAISKSAIASMTKISDSAVAILPSTDPTTNEAGEAVQVQISSKDLISDIVKEIQTDFWKSSLLITFIITVASSSMMYFFIGYALKPLKNLGEQIEDIQAKNLKHLVVADHSSIEIEQLTNAFNEMLERLSNTFSAQRQFSANAAHELRTPLAVMRTKLEVFEKNKKPSDTDYQETVNMIRMQTSRLSHVIDILLEMTDLQSAQKQDHISLADMAEEVICDLTALADKKDITISQNPGTAEIIGNDTLVYRAIYNLVENAIKYNNTGGKVTVSIKEDSEYASVIIRDNGPGIKQEDWQHIFEPFFRIDKSRSRDMGGAGLGLALVKEIARQHGGDVYVVQSSKNGTEIALKLRRK